MFSHVQASSPLPRWERGFRDAEEDDGSSSRGTGRSTTSLHGGLTANAALINADRGIGVWVVPQLDMGFRNEEHTDRSDRVPCIVTFLGTHNAADCRSVHAHGAPDVGQTIAVVHLRTANGLITSNPVGPETGSEQLAQRRSGRKGERSRVGAGGSTERVLGLARSGTDSASH